MNLMKIVFCVEMSVHELATYFTAHYGYAVHRREPDLYTDSSDNKLNSEAHRALVDRLEHTESVI